MSRQKAYPDIEIIDTPVLCCCGLQTFFNVDRQQGSKSAKRAHRENKSSLSKISSS